MALHHDLHAALFQCGALAASALKDTEQANCHATSLANLAPSIQNLIVGKRECVERGQATTGRVSEVRAHAEGQREHKSRSYSSRLQGTGCTALTFSSLRTDVTILPDLATRITSICTLMGFPHLSVTTLLPGMATRACASSSAADHCLDSSFGVSIKTLGTYTIKTLPLSQQFKPFQTL